MISGVFLIGTLWAKYLKSCLSYSLDENQHEKRGACKNLKGLYQNDSKDAKSRFSTFQLQMTFSHGYIF